MPLPEKKGENKCLSYLFFPVGAGSSGRLLWCILLLFCCLLCNATPFSSSSSFPSWLVNANALSAREKGETQGILKKTNWIRWWIFLKQINLILINKCLATCFSQRSFWIFGTGRKLLLKKLLKKCSSCTHTKKSPQRCNSNTHSKSGFFLRNTLSFAHMPFRCRVGGVSK